VVRDSLDIPWEITYGPDSNIWFTQKNGYICRLEPQSGHIDTLYNETNTLSTGEAGMLGLALHPLFPAEPYVFAAYTYYNTKFYERIVKYTYENDSLKNPVILLDSIKANGLHNGCRLLAEADKLFISTGDAGDLYEDADNVQVVNGKVLRINFDGSIPGDNPIPGSPSWSWGHRNAQGLVSANGILYSSEHGEITDDEVNIIKMGRNYGWWNVEGFCDLPAETNYCNDSNVVEPLIAWTPTIAPCGLDYYNHQMSASLQNSLLMTTLKDKSLYQLKLNASHDSIINVKRLALNYGRLRDICIAPDGKIYLSTSNSYQPPFGLSREDKILEIYYDSTMSISNPSNEMETLTIYPNPASRYIGIHTQKPLSTKLWTYEILDAEGKLLLKGDVDKHTYKIIIEGLARGIYTLRLLEAGRVSYTERVIKQ
jgi:glucose/arabinose dehydrogenase